MSVLSEVPQQGCVSFRMGRYTYHYEGWWWVDGSNVMRRTVEDTRGWRQCAVVDVIGFTPTTHETP